MTKTIEKYLSYLRYEKNCSLHTEISYSKDLNQFNDFLISNTEIASLKDADSDIIRQWIASLIESGISPRSANRKLSALKSLYRYLMRIGEISDNPVKRVTSIKSNKPLPSFVSDSDLEFILDEKSTFDNFEELRNHTMLELLYVTGMRRAELIGLNINDIDFSADLIKVTGKRNKQRLIPFSPKTKELLKTYNDVRSEVGTEYTDAFFTRENGKALYPMLVQRIVYGYLSSIKTLDKISPHILRHSFATSMLNNGAEINAVKELLGHSSLASTEVYTHTSFEELKKTYKKAHPRA